MVKYYKGLYYIGNMSDDRARTILQVRNMQVIESLKHCIYELTDVEIDDVIARGDTEDEQATKSTYTVGTLRDAQTIGVAFMYYAEAALLGDEVGLGKTVEVAGLLNVLLQEKRKQCGNDAVLNYLFLTESQSVTEIRRKLVKFTGNYVNLLDSGVKATVCKYIKRTAKPQVGNKPINFSVVGTHALMRSTEFLSFCATHTFDVVIFDESSSARNATGSSTLFRNLQLVMNKCKYKILLNATPVEVALRDMYNQFRLLDCTYLPTLHDFEALFCIKTKQGCRFVISGFKNLDIFQRATSLRYLARTRKQLGAVYADNKARLFVLELNSVQKQLQKQTSLYQQLYDYPPSIMFDIDNKLTNIPKIWATIAILEQFKLKGEKVMIYCNYRACQDSLQMYLEQYGYSVGLLNGSTPAKKRTQILEDFHSGAINVLLTNTKRSLDLQDCNHCIVYTVDTSPLKTVQVEGRLTRDFDVIGKNIYVLCMAGRELKTLYGVVQQRAKMSESATTKNHSLYMSMLLREDKIVYNVPASAYNSGPEQYQFVQVEST